MKILVTGGAGFVGSHIADTLIEKGHEVLIIDNLSTGQEENVNKNARFIKADINDFETVENIFSKEKPEIVYHLAAQIDVRKSVEDPISDARTNILGSLNLVKLSHKYGIKKFIFSSTGGAIYGDTKDRPTKEDHPEFPLSPYGIAKLATDKFLNFYHEVYGLKFVSLRYANVYGPRQNPHGEAGVVAIFLNKMVKGENPIINGDGTQTRDYVFVGDVVRANLMTLENMEITGIFNVGTSKEISVKELFSEINSHFDGIFEENYSPAKLGEQKTSCLSFEKIKKVMGWSPEVDFKDGIRKTHQWFKENKK